MIAECVVEQKEPVEAAQAAGSRRAVPWADIACLAVILAFALVFCGPVLSGKVPIAADTLRLWSPWTQFATKPVRNLPLADSSLLYLSWESFSRSAIAAGEWPLWDPYTFSGFPFAANAQNQVYYPLTWLLWLLPLSGAIQVLAIFNLCLAGWGMYLLCRVLGLSRAAALLAGLAFCGSGILQTAIELPGVASVYGWLPWMLLTAELAIRERSLRWTAAAALCCGLQAVAGHLQWVIYSYFALGLWLAVRSFQLSIERPSSGRYRLNLKALAGSLARSLSIPVLGLALAAVHLAPFLELTTHASRGNIRVSSNSEPLYYMLRMVLPNFFGTPLVVPNYPLMYNNLWYIGLAPALLVVVGLYSRPRTAAIFWTLLALFAVLVTFGVGPFLYVRWLPGLQATLPNRIGYLFVMGVCVLVGIGVDGWLRLAMRRTAFFVLVALAALFALTIYPALTAWLSKSDWIGYGYSAEYASAMRNVQAHDIARAALLGAAGLAVLGLLLVDGRRRLFPRSWAPYALVPVVVIDLLSAVPNYNSFVDAEDLRPGTTGIRWLRQQPGQWRMLQIGNEKILPSFVPNSHLIFNLPTVDGYDSLHDSRYDDLWGLVDPSVLPRPGGGPYDNVFVRPQAYTSTVASLLNVKYIVSGEPIAPPQGFKKLFSSDLFIYENPSVLPRAFVVSGATLLPPEATLQRLADPSFDPRSEVLLQPESGAQALEPTVAPGDTGSATITAYRRNSVEMQATVSTGSYLVLADPSYPGWHVSVDGREQPLLTADYLLRAVHLTPGTHTVRFWFLPSLFVPTLAISVLALLLVVAGLLLRKVPRRIGT